MFSKHFFLFYVFYFLQLLQLNEAKTLYIDQGFSSCCSDGSKETPFLSLDDAIANQTDLQLEFILAYNQTPYQFFSQTQLTRTNISLISIKYFFIFIFLNIFVSHPQEVYFLHELIISIQGFLNMVNLQLTFPLPSKITNSSLIILHSNFDLTINVIHLFFYFFFLKYLIFQRIVVSISQLSPTEAFP